MQNLTKEKLISPERAAQDLFKKNIYFDEYKGEDWLSSVKCYQIHITSFSDIKVLGRADAD